MGHRRVVLVAIALGLGAGSAAGQQADVREAVNGTLSAWAAGDFETFASFYDPGARGFFMDGGPLSEGLAVSALRAGYEAGFRAELSIRDLQVRTYGDAAVSSAYLEGTITLPGGGTIPGTWRYTETRVRQGGQWKVVQFHFSPLTAAASR